MKEVENGLLIIVLATVLVVTAAIPVIMWDFMDYNIKISGGSIIFHRVLRIGITLLLLLFEILVAFYVKLSTDTYRYDYQHFKQK